MHGYVLESDLKKSVNILTEALDFQRKICPVSSLVLIDQKSNRSARLSGMFQQSEISKSPLTQVCLTKQVNKL